MSQMPDAGAPNDRPSAVANPLDKLHWQRLQDLYHLASQAPPGERTRMLMTAGADAALVARVLELLTADDDASGVPEMTAHAGSGSRVGPYRLLEHIGMGGLGVVYLAERLMGGAVQRCALKVLRSYAAGAAMQARFLREQQIIASLDHPHITRMLDAGFALDGEPWLALELVDGTTITEHCDRAAMDVNARVRLFLEVCEAVSYAHSRLVVHLDLKPSNILVTREGSTKLLDFGTSKLVAEGDTLTATILATPAYASPEQIRNEPITTACDVYGLGAVLYELLSGTRPWQDASPTRRLEQALREMEPGALTDAVMEGAAEKRGEGSVAALRQRLGGDLSSIAAQCMRSRAEERYRSVDALREDLSRYLAGRPVLAQRQTVRYRMSKFVRRRRGPLLAAAAVLAVVVGSLSYGAVRQQQAVQQGERAERMQNFLYSTLRLANTNYSGHPVTTMNEFLQMGVRALPEYIHNDADRRAARLSLAESMFDNSDFEHALPVLMAVREEARAAKDVPAEAEATAFAGMTQSALGRYDDANRLLEKAMAVRDRRGVSPAQRLWIVGFYTSNRYNMGVRQLDDATLLRKTIDAGRDAAIPDRERGWALGNLATLHSRVNHVDDAQREAEEALAVLRRQPYTACDQSFVETLLGDVENNRGNDSAALTKYQDGYRDIVACKGAEDLGSLELQVPLGRLLVKLGRGDEAAGLLEPSVGVWRRTLPGNPEIGYLLTTLAQARVLQGRSADAVTMAQEALVAEDGKFPKTGTAMGLTYAVLAQGLAGTGDRAGALEAATHAEGIFGALPTVSSTTRRIAEGNKALLATLR